jgi:hypothetical protein
MMFADRLPLRSLWLGLAVLGGMAALRCERASLTPAPAPVICVPAPFDAPVTVTAESIRARADHLYRQRQFDAAARAAAGDGMTVAPRILDDVDLKNLAEQYTTLAVAWEIGFDTNNAPGNRFMALREAWKLDTVLGGAYTDELYAALRDIAPSAIEAFTAANDRESAMIARETLSALGPRHLVRIEGRRR